MITVSPASSSAQADVERHLLLTESPRRRPRRRSHRRRALATTAVALPMLGLIGLSFSSEQQPALAAPSPGPALRVVHVHQIESTMALPAVVADAIEAEPAPAKPKFAYARSRERDLEPVLASTDEPTVDRVAAAPPVATPSIASKPTVLTPSPRLAINSVAPQPIAAQPKLVARDAAPSPAAPAAAPAATGETVVYLIDISGSMVDVLPEASAWVAAEIARLNPADSAAVIGFNSDRVVLNADGVLPASTGSVYTLRRWMRTQLPANASGRSDVEAALFRALSLKPDRLVIVSDDSFSKRSMWGSGERLYAELTGIVSGAGVELDTAQVAYGSGHGVLTKLAQRAGGNFTFVAPSTNRKANRMAPAVVLGR